MYDKEKLGKRYACFQCGTKFYDLNRPEPTCPECNADQRTAPERDIKALLAGRKGRAEEADDIEADEEEIDEVFEDEEDDADEEDDDAAFEEDE